MRSARSSKRDIEKAREVKAAAKRERRQGGGGRRLEAEGPKEGGRSQDELLAALANLHERFEQGLLTFADFESEKAGLIGELDGN